MTSVHKTVCYNPFVHQVPWFQQRGAVESFLDRGDVCFRVVVKYVLGDSVGFYRMLSDAHRRVAFASKKLIDLGLV